MPRLDSLYTQISAVGALSATPKIQANLHDASLLFSQLRQGQVLSGEIIGKNGNSTYTLRIGQQLLELPLQEELKPGDTLQLRLTSHTPEIQISILSSKSTHTEQHLFQLEHLNGKVYFREIPSSVQPALSSSVNSSIADLSSAAHLLDQLTTEAREFKGSEITRLPAVQFNPGEVDSIRQHLEATLRQSGLFSYSHIKKYAEGELKESEFLEEMSAKVTADEATAPLQLLKQQITALENQTVHLQFSAPGNVEVQWLTKHDEHKKQNSIHTENIDSWQSEMHLSFPELGQVAVKMMLFGNNLSLHCTVSNECSGVLRKDASALQSRLNNAGLNPQISFSELP
jgi:hypothetical protein